MGISQTLHLATYSYDVMSPMDKFLFTDKDNIFLSLKTTTVDQMSYMRDATINMNWKRLPDSV